MKKSYVLIISLVALSITAILTNPPRERHEEEVKLKANTYLKHSLSSNDDLGDFGKAAGLLFGGFVVNRLIENVIEVENYSLFSLTKLTWDGQTSTIAIGAFGNIFFFPKANKAFDSALLD